MKKIKRQFKSLLALFLCLLMITGFSPAQMILAASEPVGDPMVYYTQKWLNQEYGNVPGFGSVTENGKTGWDIIYGLTRALQHELGIVDLANSFGATTSALYGQNILQKQSGITDRKFAILQGALWCKGYDPGYNLYENNGVVIFNGVFDENVEQAVIHLKRDAYGTQNQDGVVTLNIMKALLSMDTFKLSSSSGGKAEIRTMQQKFNRKYEAYTGICSCDGVYNRNMNTALVYALQAEEGLPPGIANGSFGPATQRCCPQIPYTENSTAAKSYSNTYYTDTQISSFTELMQFALYVNGFGNGNFDGVFGSGTKQALEAFQKHHALPVTGEADKGTWMSLFLSSGDPSRPATGADCAMILNQAKAQTLYGHGYRYVGRYLTGTYNGGVSKAITKEEAQIIFDAGLRFFPIYQTSSNNAAYFTEERGSSDAKAAIAAAEALGLPRDTIIYFAVDFDAMESQIISNVIPYFKKVHDTMSLGIYKTGIYGTRNVCSRVAAMGYSCSSFVGDMSTGFSGNLGFRLPDDWAFDQFANLEGDNALGQGDGRIEIDKNAVSGRDQGVSELIPVPAITTIAMKSLPSKKVYKLGENLNVKGAKITVTYSDSFKTDIDITSGMVTGYNKNKTGKQTLIVTFGGKTASFAVTVNKITKTFTVRFNKKNKNAKGIMNAVKAAEGKNVKLPKNRFTLKGYKFKGWATSKTAKKTAYKNGNIIKKIKKNMTLYAVWTKNKA